jgi:xanthine dehydrogenase YagS FAD-binding subunit
MCHSVHPSGLAPVLIALDTRARLLGPQGERKLPLEEIYAEPRADRRRTTVFEPGELVVRIDVPTPPEGSRGIYLRVMEQKSRAFALVSLAVQIALGEGWGLALASKWISASERRI